MLSITANSTWAVTSVKVNKEKNDDLINFFESLEEDDDVQNIFSNAEFTK